MAVKEITDKDFDKVVEENDVVIVDFWAPWCGPCLMMGPIFEELSEDHSEWTFARLNVDENPIKANEFGVTGIPTFIIFKDGEAVKRVVGARPRESIEREIKDAIEE